MQLHVVRADDRVRVPQHRVPAEPAERVHLLRVHLELSHVARAVPSGEHRAAPAALPIVKHLHSLPARLPPPPLVAAGADLSVHERERLALAARLVQQPAELGHGERVLGERRGAARRHDGRPDHIGDGRVPEAAGVAGGTEHLAHARREDGGELSGEERVDRGGVARLDAHDASGEEGGAAGVRVPLLQQPRRPEEMIRPARHAQVAKHVGRGDVERAEDDRPEAVRHHRHAQHGVRRAAQRVD
eukprot:CAMPEP_0195645230 /NCGR_PEP_ID=MMETSP0815-20121206/28826_1 /TAXON_ID=97485 /ORGANISM="Prymnesium parvum, Strain Texoma1" /LENGTH=244 /DNA_ID=CAMNT_0040788461 /DNA_START=636 /DNA_END=1367 /DNA_ORIENTATION=+